MKVGILKDWDGNDILLRQSPGGQGRWKDMEFVLDDPSQEYDYIIVLNSVVELTNVRCKAENIWSVVQEPPNKQNRFIHRGNESYHRTYTCDPSLIDERYVHSFPVIPWRVHKSYDELLAMKHIAKEKKLSWITSNLSIYPGHRDRMSFLSNIQGAVDFDLFGRGFQFIEDKWDAIAPYEYSIAIENYANPYYWSEKISDCFLSYTMPIYYGCTDIENYFPAESFVRINIHDPHVGEHIRDIINSGLAERNKEAIHFARDKVLNEYNFFGFLYSEIQKDIQTHVGDVKEPYAQNTLIPVKRDKRDFFVLYYNRFKSLLAKLGSFLKFK